MMLRVAVVVSPDPDEVKVTGPETMQLPEPVVHVRATLPANPSWDAMLMTPVVLALPAFTFGKEAGPASVKVGLGTTFNVKGGFKDTVPSGVVACSVTG